MSDQCWVLQAHIHQNTATSSVQFTNTTSQNCTNAAGQTTLMSYGNAPVFRILCKVMFLTSANSLGSSGLYFYGNYQSNNDYSHDYMSGTSNSTLYPNAPSQTSPEYNYSTAGQYMGYGAMGSQFSSFDWGSAVTDVEGNSVASNSRRRSAWNVIWLENHFPNQSAYYPWSYHNSIVTDQQSDGSSSQGTTNWGAWVMGAGGCSAGPYIDNITIQSSYNFYGDFFLFRGLNGSYQVNE